MVTADTNHMLRWNLGKPDIDIIKSLLVLLLEAAKVSAVNENIALRNGQLSVLPMGISDYAE
jgi:hypothetical protein